MVSVFWKSQPFLTLSNIYKSIYHFSLFIFRLSAVCLLSVCPYTNSIKCIWITLKLISAIDIYYGMFNVENEDCNSDSLFTRTLRRIPLCYGLCGRIICCDFELCFTILSSLTFIYIPEVHYRITIIVNGIDSMHSSFTSTLKRIPRHYGLRGKIFCDIFIRVKLFQPYSNWYISLKYTERYFL